MNKTDLINFLRTPFPRWGDTKFDRDWRDATAAKFADALEAEQASTPYAYASTSEHDSIITSFDREHNTCQYSDEFLATHTLPLYAHPSSLAPLTAEILTDAFQWRDAKFKKMGALVP
jgi:hypothetical protein